MRIDLRGYRPSEIVWNGLLIKIVRQCWQMGESELRLVHGHGRARGKTPGFVNTKTGVFGLAIRHAFRRNKELRQWIKHTTLDCRKWGATTVKLKPNPAPSRTRLDAGLIADRQGAPLRARRLPTRFPAPGRRLPTAAARRGRPPTSADRPGRGRRALEP
jgi:hypothetical protein